jgi:hypothetical protein
MRQLRPHRSAGAMASSLFAVLRRWR